MLVSEFFNELFTFSFETHRWFPLAVRGATAAAGAQGDAPSPSAHGPSLAAPACLPAAARAAITIQSHYRGHVVRKAYKLYRVGGVVSEILYSPALAGVVPPRGIVRPFGRINALLAVHGNTLYVYGGIIEAGDKEVTLDDLWSLDLVKLDGWTAHHHPSISKDELQPELSSDEEEPHKRCLGAVDSDSDEDSDDEMLVRRGLSGARAAGGASKFNN